MRPPSVLLTVVASVCLNSVACKKADKKADDPGAPAPAAAPLAGTPAAAAKPTAPKLTCDQAFPKALQDKYFPGQKVTSIPQPVDDTVECEIAAKAPGEPTGKVQVACSEHMAEAMQPTIDGLKKAMKDTKDLPGVGKAAVTLDIADMATSVTAWDDNSNCQTMVFAPKGVDAVALAKDLLAILPIK